MWEWLESGEGKIGVQQGSNRQGSGGREDKEEGRGRQTAYAAGS
jgi:hypothetical protein